VSHESIAVPRLSVKNDPQIAQIYTDFTVAEIELICEICG
jgi:hypothetical protein